MRVRTEPCDWATATKAVMRWHYSKRMPRGAKLTYATFEDDRFVGVLIFGVGVGKGTPVPSVDVRHALELQRVALREHAAPVSQHLAAAIRRLRAHHAIRLLVSYADPAQGHHGGIYQAAGWTYIGKSPPSKGYRAPTGEIKHSRVVTPTGYNRQFGETKRAWRADVFEPVTLPGKHLYLLGLDRPTRRAVALLARAYPTRVSSVHGDTSEFRSEEAGSTPAARSGA
jgi:hypothetical protein